MNFDLETYMESRSLSKQARELLREQAKHSVSVYTLDGRHLKNPYEQENLWKLLTGMERYIVDTNSEWRNESKKPSNRNKAFIIGRTINDEEENIRSVFFGRKTDISNNNLFAFGYAGPPQFKIPCLLIDRVDKHFEIIHDAKGLNEESRPRAKRKGAEFLESESEHMKNVFQMKQVILKILQLSDIANLPPDEEAEFKRIKLIQIIRSKASRCFKNYVNAVEVACLCYSRLLLEPDALGNQIRKEFAMTDYRNVFGDTALIQNALILKARIYSKDKAASRMAEFLGVSEIIATHKI